MHCNLKRINKFLSTSILLGFFAAGIGCAPTQLPENNKTAIPTKAISVSPQLSDSEKAILALQNPNTPVTTQTATLFLNHTNWNKSSNVTLAQVNFARLRIADHEKNAAHVLNLANEIDISKLNPQQQLALRQARIRSHEALYEYEKAAYLTSKDCEKNPDSECVESTMKLLFESQEKINSQLNPNDQQWQKWVSFSNILLNTNGSLNAQLTQVTHWFANHPQHPISLHPPKVVKVLQSITHEKSVRIAVVLPTTGPLTPYGNSIKRGIIERFYSFNKADQATIHLEFFDSNKIGQSQFEQELNKFNLIIGPLSKNKVKEALTSKYITTQILALNTVSIKSTANQYQFALDTQGEGSNAAHYLRSSGYKKPLIISKDLKIDHELADEFISTWNDEGKGQLNTTAALEQTLTVNSQYGKQISTILGINQSRTRANEIKRSFDRNLQYNPRRRQDIDSVFLTADNPTTEQIIPLLEFYYAEDIPIFGTSRAYTETDQAINNDLNDITIQLPPWVLNPTLSDYKNSNYTNRQLRAMGADAMSLAPRLKLLTLVPNAKVSGLSGQLSINDNHDIQRRLSWTSIINGKPTTTQIQQ